MLSNKIGISGSGCYSCMENRHCTADYRSSRCASTRSRAGLDFDPFSHGDNLRTKSDHDLAEFLANEAKGCPPDSTHNRTSCEHQDSLHCHACWFDYLTEPLSRKNR